MGLKLKKLRTAKGPCQAPLAGRAKITCKYENKLVPVTESLE